MKKFSVLIATVAIVGFAAAGAHAQCAADGPAKAKGLKTSLIRSYAACPSATFLAPNSSTGTGVPTCAPPFAHSAYQFDNRKGSCQFSTKAKLEDPCSDGSGVPCSNLAIQAKCGGILDPDGVTPTNSAGWAVSTVSRATLDDPDNGDMTVIDFPIQIAFPPASKGKLKVKTDSNTLLGDLGLAALPGCAQVEVVTLAIQDPAGQPFAKMGAGTRPKGL